MGPIQVLNSLGQSRHHHHHLQQLLFPESRCPCSGSPLHIDLHKWGTSAAPPWERPEGSSGALVRIMDLWAKWGGHEASVLEVLGGSGGAKAGGNKNWRIQKLFSPMIVTFVCFKMKVGEIWSPLSPFFCPIKNGQSLLKNHWRGSDSSESFVYFVISNKHQIQLSSRMVDKGRKIV